MRFWLPDTFRRLQNKHLKLSLSVLTGLGRQRWFMCQGLDHRPAVVRRTLFLRGEVCVSDAYEQNTFHLTIPRGCATLAGGPSYEEPTPRIATAILSGKSLSLVQNS
jgi:hypothetical protein